VFTARYGLGPYITWIHFVLKGLIESVLIQSVKNGTQFLYKQCLTSKLPYRHNFLFFPRPNSPQRARASWFTTFLDHTQRRTTVVRTPLDEWSVRRTDLYLTTHNTHNRQTSMPPGGIRTRNPSSREVADSHLRPRGHWHRQTVL